MPPVLGPVSPSPTRLWSCADPNGTTYVGLRGPGGIQLYSPAAPHLTAINRYLRFGSGIAPGLREVAILTTAREHSHQFEWTMHEPMALALQSQAWYCGHTWEACPDETTPDVVNLQVDWVAIYAPD